MFISSVFLAIKGIKFQRKHAKLSEYSLDEQIKILDTLGDLYCQAKAFHKALGCYKKEVLLFSIASSACLLYHFNLLFILKGFFDYAGIKLICYQLCLDKTLMFWVWGLAGLKPF